MVVALNFSCTHAPFMRDGVVDFLNDLKKEWKATTINMLGDIMDFHALGNWDKEADSWSLVEEHEKAIKQLQELYKAFPEVNFCTSNHDNRPYRKAAQVGIPSNFLKGHAELLELPKGWKVATHHIVDGVRVQHSYPGGAKSLQNAINRYGRSVVLGHQHSLLRVEAYPTDMEYRFGANCGSCHDLGKDIYAFRYNKEQNARPVTGGVIVIDGRHAYPEHMNLGSKVTYK